jgi:hypothetical protein
VLVKEFNKTGFGTGAFVSYGLSCTSREEFDGGETRDFKLGTNVTFSISINLCNNTVFNVGVSITNLFVNRS